MPLPFAHATETAAARVFIVAELGVNHDGDVSRALHLTQAAHRAGADAIKLQVFDPDALMSKACDFAAYQRDSGENAPDPRSMLARLALRDEEMRQVAAAARALGLAVLATPFSLSDVPRVAALGVDAVKIASPDAVNTPLLDTAAALRLPMFIATGTCDEAELDAAAMHALASAGCLMQCVSAYPTADGDAALGGIAALRSRFGVAVGYSDHTASEHTGALAVAAGACVLEKHLTLDRSAPGPDHAASMDEPGFARYAAAARAAAAAVGPRRKAALPVELDVRRVSRQSVCTTRALPVGATLTVDDLALKRPGTGIPAAQLARVVGRRLARAAAADVPLQPGDLA